MDINDIDWKSLTPDQIKIIEKNIDKAKNHIKNSHKNEFLSNVVGLAIDKSVKWTEAQALMKDYVPKSDVEAKKLGFKYKKVDESNVTRYFGRRVKNSIEI